MPVLKERPTTTNDELEPHVPTDEIEDDGLWEDSASVIAARRQITERRKNAWVRTVSMWTRPFTRGHRVPVFKRVWLYIAAMAVYTIFVDWFSSSNVPFLMPKEAGDAGAYGSVVLGLLLVFRTNSAYERWWEGRKLWGQLTNDSRNLSIKVRSMVNVTPAEKKRFGELVISFAYALKHHLRDTSPSRPLPGLKPTADRNPHHLPVHISEQIYDMMTSWIDRKIIDGQAFLALDVHARGLMDVCGGCERIRSSPIAVSYRAFMRQGIGLNMIAWPWYLTSKFTWWWSLPPILIGSYFLVGIELIAEDVEDPFGMDGDDLPLDSLCATIKSTVGKTLDVHQNMKFTTTIEKPRLDILKDTQSCQ